MSPVLTELSHISTFPGIEPIVIIDDARLFKSGTGYPTLETVFKAFESWAEPMSVSVHDDAIIAFPRQLALRSSA